MVSLFKIQKVNYQKVARGLSSLTIRLFQFIGNTELNFSPALKLFKPITGFPVGKNNLEEYLCHAVNIDRKYLKQV
jgi:hypothetical protein